MATRWTDVPAKPGHHAREGFQMFYGRGVRATLNKNLGDALEGRRVMWAIDRTTGKLGFRILAKDEPGGVVIRHYQVIGTILRKCGVVRGTRLWFEFADDPDPRFVEIKREVPEDDDDPLS